MRNNENTPTNDTGTPDQNAPQGKPGGTNSAPETFLGDSWGIFDFDQNHDHELAIRSIRWDKIVATAIHEHPSEPTPEEWQTARLLAKAPEMQAQLSVIAALLGEAGTTIRIGDATATTIRNILEYIDTPKLMRNPVAMPTRKAHDCGCEHHGILTTCPIHATEPSPFNVNPAGHLSHAEKKGTHGS